MTQEQDRQSIRLILTGAVGGLVGALIVAAVLWRGLPVQTHHHYYHNASPPMPIGSAVTATPDGAATEPGAAIGSNAAFRPQERTPPDVSGARPPEAAISPQAPGAPYVAPAGRSPIPQPGEQIARPFPYRPAAPPTAAAPLLSEDAIVPWHQAGHYVGQTITVEGRVVVARNTGTVCFLNFAADWRGLFYVIIFEEALDLWPVPPEQHFLNRNIRVRGEVYEHRNQPQIRIRHAEQVQIVP